MYEKLKNMYQRGLLTKQQLQNAITKGWITEEQYKEITE